MLQHFTNKKTNRVSHDFRETEATMLREEFSAINGAADCCSTGQEIPNTLTEPRD